MDGGDRRCLYAVTYTALAAFVHGLPSLSTGRPCSEIQGRERRDAAGVGEA